MPAKELIREHGSLLQACNCRYGFIAIFSTPSRWLAKRS